MMPGPTQILIIVILLLLIFGASRVPAIMENLAKGVTSFKKGLKEDDEEQDTENSGKPLENKSSEDVKSKDKDKVDG